MEGQHGPKVWEVNLAPLLNLMEVMVMLKLVNLESKGPPVLPDGFTKRIWVIFSVCLILEMVLVATIFFSVTDGHPMKQNGAYAVVGLIVLLLYRTSGN